VELQVLKALRELQVQQALMEQAVPLELRALKVPPAPSASAQQEQRVLQALASRGRLVLSE
jgi:hypothetical protein